MKRLLLTFIEEKNQVIIYFVISFIILIFSAFLRSIEREIFNSRLGNVNQLISIPILSLIGLFCVTVLIHKKWFAVYAGWNAKGIRTAVWLSVVFFIVVIILDWTLRFPREINIPFPRSLLYYPVVGFVVDVLFHIVLLMILIFALRLLLPNISVETVLWVAIVLVALVEPVYQMVAGAATDGWTLLVILTGVHVFLINFAQLYLFKRYDFATMYFMRLCYYLLWHVIWGVIRLNLLF